MGHNVQFMLDAIRAGSGGFMTRIFGGQKKKAADAASFDLQTRLAEADATVQTMRQLVARANVEIGTSDPAQIFATNAFGLKDATGQELARFAGEQWPKVNWTEIPTYRVQAFHRVVATIDTEERKHLIGGMRGDMVALKEERARLTLRDVPVDKLRELTQGSVRTAPLAKAGIATVNDVLSHDVHSLTQVPGVGESTAAQIIAVAHRLLDESMSYEKEAVGEVRTPAAERMLVALHRLRDIDATFSDSDLLARLRSYQPLLAQPVPASSPFYVAYGDDTDDLQQFVDDLAWCEANQNLSVAGAQ
ncbi:helix-hairpin-helix domain-containing protein [Rothia terrae]|uniref:helix-hairpin-helix domain-containing protein n=1 Tax=Rothia terrae TaxID=396015 RepID=UPI002882733C|nr:helix-hairpin-helix domain-containing protein [Rothia terrae]MDT0190457.1 helix-hairpin-helix domain-containing protein [Rothia terrae]